MLQEVNVRVPATTANMGAGFDTFGMALAMYNTIGLRRLQGRGIRLANVGSHTKSMEQPRDNLTVRAARRVFDTVHERFSGLEFKMYNVIPVSRGLGSSAAAIVGGLLAANLLLGEPLSREEHQSRVQSSIRNCWRQRFPLRFTLGIILTMDRKILCPQASGRQSGTVPFSLRKAITVTAAIVP